MFTTHRALDSEGRWSLHRYKLEQARIPEVEMEEIREGLAIGLTIQKFSAKESFHNRVIREVRSEEGVSTPLGDYIVVAPGLRVLPEEYNTLPMPTIAPSCELQRKANLSIRKRMKKGIKKITQAKVSKKKTKASIKKDSPTPKQKEYRGPSQVAIARAQRVRASKAKAKVILAAFVASRKAKTSTPNTVVDTNGFTNPDQGNVNWDLIDSRSGPPVQEADPYLFFGDTPVRGIVQPSPKNNKRKGA